LKIVFERATIFFLGVRGQSDCGAIDGGIVAGVGGMTKLLAIVPASAGTWEEREIVMTLSDTQ
jgi:hypothetical protein